MKPSIGRIVVYNTSEEERKTMKDSGQNVQERLPAIIVATWQNQGETASEDTAVNLKVFVDGIGEIWKTSCKQGTGPNQWMEPARV
jgi:hypothetical protein